jgi:histidine triad (HIT) family protein
METDCLFCKIANNQTETEMVHETKDLVVFRDINPHAPIHLLIVPRKHIRSVNDLEDDDHEIVSKLVFTAKEMALKMGINESGYRVFFNVEKGGGQMIFHIHLHMIGGWK